MFRRDIRVSNMAPKLRAHFHVHCMSMRIWTLTNSKNQLGRPMWTYAENFMMIWPHLTEQHTKLPIRAIIAPPCESMRLFYPVSNRVNVPIHSIFLNVRWIRQKSKKWDTLWTRLAKEFSFCFKEIITNYSQIEGVIWK